MKAETLRERYQYFKREAKRLEAEAQRLREQLGDRHDETIEYLLKSAEGFVSAAWILADIRDHEKVGQPVSEQEAPHE